MVSVDTEKSNSRTAPAKSDLANDDAMWVLAITKKKQDLKQLVYGETPVGTIGGGAGVRA